MIRENKSSFKNIAIRFVLLFFGFFFCALGHELFLFCDLGSSPWTVFHEGLSKVFPITVGQASQIVGLVIIIIGIFFKIIPGIGTLCNMFFIGLMMDKIHVSGILFIPSTFIGKVLVCLAGTVSVCFGIYLYMSQEFGAGPRDGVMMAFTQRTKFNVGFIKNAMEITVLVIGALLGGKFGIGTVISSLISGPILQTMFKLFKVNPKELNQENILDIYKRIRKSA